MASTYRRTSAAMRRSRSAASAALWKIGQLRPGNRVRFVPLSFADAAERLAEQTRVIETRAGRAPARASPRALQGPVLQRTEHLAPAPHVVYRPQGDQFLL